MNGKLVVVAIGIIIAISAIVVAINMTESYGRFGEIDMRLESVNGSHAVITLLIDIDKTPSFNRFEIGAKIYDVRTNLLVGEYSKSFTGYGKYYRAEFTIPFEKTRDYQLKLILKKGERIYDTTHVNVRNLRYLVPEDMTLKASMAGADFLLTGSDNETVSFKSRFYIESLSDYDVVARTKVVQSESNVLVGDEWRNITLEGGKTNIVEADFTVPKKYNYVVKLEIWRNGKLVKTWKDYLNLAPKKIIPEGVKEENMEFEVDRFVKNEEDYARRSGAIPGFEVAVGLAAIGGALALRRQKGKV
ncbi:DUF7490 domain-containing protein [Archaeoglobus neptunius]|uniref:DUF7490 domain-containing protein n=1 Tax=Archaeoglobus neptunius TaxID=2798580 RepID=UPI0019259EDD|nr:PGF-CTERM sorting domain-containing protein [Archaeoglobus neptunius]